MLLRCLSVCILLDSVSARGRCRPETRCINSPDEGLSDSSEFTTPVNVSTSEMNIWIAQMAEYSTPGINGGRKCMHGHTNLEGTTLPLSETRMCTLPSEQDWCGWSVAPHVCTCVSSQRAKANYDATSDWALFGVFLFFALSSGVYTTVLACQDGCDDMPSNCDSPKFWLLFLIWFLMPFGFLGGSVVMLVRALRDPNDPATYGYARLCGSYNSMNMANPVGFVFVIVGSSLLVLCFVVIPAYCICIKPLLCPDVRTRHASRRRHQEFMSRVDAAAAAPRHPGRPVLTSAEVRARIGGSARNLVRDTHAITLDLATPARFSRAASGRHYNVGSLRRPVAANIVASAAVVKSGWMIRVVPSYIGVSKRMFYALYDNQQLQFYDEEKTPPHEATCHGKLDLNKMSSIDTLAKDSFAKADQGQTISDFFMVIKVNSGSRGTDWIIDAGSEAGRAEWMDAIRETKEKPVVVVATAMAAGPASVAPVVSAIVVGATSVDAPAVVSA